MAARVKETAKEEALHVRQLAEDGVKSGAYIYPIKVSTAVFTIIDRQYHENDR
jgi:hypothetical protein